MFGTVVNYKCPYCNKLSIQEFGACTTVVVYNNTEYIMTNCKECSSKLAVRDIQFRRLYFLEDKDNLCSIETDISRIIYTSIGGILDGNTDIIKEYCYEQIVKSIKSRFKRGHKQLNLERKQEMNNYLYKYSNQIKECIDAYINEVVKHKEEFLALAFCDEDTKSKAENAKIKYITEKDCSHMMTCCF